MSVAEGPVFVTGATGFLGGKLVELLCARGIETHVLARASSERGTLERLPLRWHAGDLTDEASLERALAAVSASAARRGTRARVIHSAALISYLSRDSERQREINVEGTRRMLEGSLRHGVARFVHVSSVVTVGHSPDGRPLDERAPFASGKLGVDYVDTKRAAEELVLAARDRLAVVVVNPSAIFGLVERPSNAVRFMQELARGKRPFATPPGGIAVVGVEDTALGTLAALERGRPGERYILSESNWTTHALFNLMAREIGARPIRWSLPRWPWPLLVLGARIVDRVRPMTLTPPQALVLLGKTMAFDSSKARRELAWNPRPFEQILHETVASLRERGVLPPERTNA